MSVQIEYGATDVNLPSLMYQNILEDGSLTATSEAQDGSVGNAAEDTTFDFWTPSVVPSSAVIDYGSDVECDFAGIAAHNAGTVGATILIQSSDNGSNWVTRSTLEPLTNETLLTIFPAVSARYWRIRMKDAICSIGVIKIGKRLIIPGGVLSGHTAANHSKRVVLMQNESIKGQFLGNRIKRIGGEFNVNFGLVDSDFVENDMAVFESHFNSGRTFFYASFPTGLPNDYAYCWRGAGNGEMRPPYDEGSSLMSVSIDVESYIA